MRAGENLKSVGVEASDARQAMGQNLNFILKSISGYWRV